MTKRRDVQLSGRRLLPRAKRGDLKSNDATMFQARLLKLSAILDATVMIQQLLHNDVVNSIKSVRKWHDYGRGYHCEIKGLAARRNGKLIKQ